MLPAEGPAKSARSSRRRSVGARGNYQDGSESDELNDDIPKPRFSLPLDVDEDDSFQAPPRLSILPNDDNNTQTSIEAPRRAIPNEDLTRSRASMRMSDRFEDISGFEDADFRIDVPFQGQVPWDVDGALHDALQDSVLEDSTGQGYVTRYSPD